MSVQFCDAGYRWAHSRKPRGTGVWWVAFNRDTDAAVEVPGGAQSWASARQWATMEARRRGAAFVTVMP